MSNKRGLIGLQEFECIKDKYRKWQKINPFSLTARLIIALNTYIHKYNVLKKKYNDYVNWKYISRYQNLSEKFCNEFNIPFTPNKRNCGKCKRNIYIESGPINIGCFKGTKEEVIKAINNSDYYSKSPLERSVY